MIAASVRSLSLVPPSHHRIRIQIFDEFRDLCSGSRLERTATQALRAASEAGASTGSPQSRLDVVVADDDTVKRLNSEYRGLDQTTDVLAFSFEHEGEYMGYDSPSAPPDDFYFILPPAEEAWLGEVIISYPQAVRQARQSGRDAGRELTALLVHGVLHLLGYDHVEPAEEAAMKALESLILDQAMSDE